MSSIRIRLWEPSDTSELMDLFRNTVWLVNSRHYSPGQILAWAPPQLDTGLWQERIAGHRCVVAMVEKRVAGFAELRHDGYIAMFYGHAEHQRCGVGRALLLALEDWAHAQQNRRVFVEASLSAVPFFQHVGFRYLGRQTIYRRGVPLANVRMEKLLQSGDS